MMDMDAFREVGLDCDWERQDKLLAEDELAEVDPFNGPGGSNSLGAQWDRIRESKEREQREGKGAFEARVSAGLTRDREPAKWAGCTFAEEQLRQLAAGQARRLASMTPDQVWKLREMRPCCWAGRGCSHLSGGPCDHGARRFVVGAHA